MQVPKQSVIAKVFAGHADLEFQPQQECLSWWESEGQHLPQQSMTVEAMSAGANRILALCVPDPE